MKPVNTKKDFVRRYSKGEFGNCSPTWNTVEECLNSSYSGSIHVRNRIAGGPTWYDVNVSDLLSVYKAVLSSCLLKKEDLYFSAMCPTEKTLIQGEVRQSVNHLDLLYSTAKLPMRQALAQSSLHANGLKAKVLLETSLCPNSLDWLYTLLRKYNGHVVEFTALSTNWGTLPNYNTLYWEVRNY